MSWNTGLQVNNLATKLNNLSKSVITNPLTSTLNANNQGISNVSNIAIQSLKDSTGTNGTTDQILTVAPSGLSVWKSPIVSTVFYVDGTSGNNANLGSQTFPFKTIQYALDKCVDATNAKYFTVYVVPYNGGIGYNENLIISYKRVNLIGIQTTANCKSVATKSLLITATQSSGASLDVICVQNFLFIGDNTLPTIWINNASTGGGYSFYLSNCEIITSATNIKNIELNPTIASTRYYFSNNIITNLATNKTTNMIDILKGSVWLFSGNVINNVSSSIVAGEHCVPIVVGADGTITGGFRNSSIETTQGVCIVNLTTNGGNPYVISGCSFTFTALNTTNTLACLVLGSGTLNPANVISISGCTFVNKGATSALSQIPFIRLNATTVISTSNSFNMTFFPSDATTQSQIYPVGNYSTNSTTGYYIFSGSTYANGSTTYAIPNFVVPAKPVYPTGSPVISSYQVNDALTNTPTITPYYARWTLQPSGTALLYKGLSTTTQTSFNDGLVYYYITFFNLAPFENVNWASPTWIPTTPRLQFPVKGIWNITFSYDFNNCENIFDCFISKNGNDNNDLNTSKSISIGSFQNFPTGTSISPAPTYSGLVRGFTLSANVSITNIATDYISIGFFTYNQISGTITTKCAQRTSMTISLIQQVL